MKSVQNLTGSQNSDGNMGDMTLDPNTPSM